MTEHPPPADLDRLVQGTLSADEKRRLFAHLLGRCPRCCSALAHFGGFDVAGVVAAEDYQGALDRAFAAAARFAAPRREAAETLAALLASDSDRLPGAGCHECEHCSRPPAGCDTTTHKGCCGSPGSLAARRIACECASMAARK
jgi:anti-sigma factor RsiW